MSGEALRTSDGVALHLHDWAVPGAKATVAIIHGYGEHGARYAHVAQALNAAGVSALAVDLRGHGRSGGPRGHVLRFSEYHRDVDALLERARQRSSGHKLFVLAHSMGGLVAVDYLLAGGGKDVAGLVLSSPFFGVALAANPLKLALGRVMSRVWPGLSLPTGLGGEHVTRGIKAQIVDRRRKPAQTLRPVQGGLEPRHKALRRLTNPRALCLRHELGIRHQHHSARSIHGGIAQHQCDPAHGLVQHTDAVIVLRYRIDSVGRRRHD